MAGFRHRVSEKDSPHITRNVNDGGRIFYHTFGDCVLNCKESVPGLPCLDDHDDDDDDDDDDDGGGGGVVVVIIKSSLCQLVQDW